MIFYYSGCGNSKWLAEELAGKLNEKALFIPELNDKGFDEYSFDGDESLGFVFPIYAWAPPRVVENFIHKVEWKGKPTYVWFACTCGDEMGMAHQLFDKILRKKNLTLDAAFGFKMPETYLCFPGFKLDTKEKEAQKIAEADAKLPKVAEQIRNREKVLDLIKGPLPRLKSSLLRWSFDSVVSDKKYFTTDNCIGCGKCESACPFHNIKMVDGKPQWQGNCTQCMACYQYCPKNAIQYGTCTQGKGQYHFRKV